MATPHVTGVAALLLGKGCPAGRIRPILQNTARDLGPAGFDNEYGYGLIDARAALNAAGADLIISALRGLGATSRDELGNGHAVFRWRVKNKGCTTTKATFIKFWLSADTVKDTGDMYLGRSSVPSLKGGTATGLTEVSLNLKNQVDPDQTWYVIGIVDPGNLVGEVKETNNQKAARLTDR